jgi:hypothetical protein
LATGEGAGPEATGGASRRAWGGAGAAEEPAGPDGRTVLPAEAPDACVAVDAATTPGGGGTRRWLEELTMGEGLAGTVLPGAPIPGGAGTLSVLDGAVEPAEATVVVGRVPADTVWGCAAGNTPAGATGTVLAAATPRPTTVSACGPAGTTAAGLPARGEAGVCNGAGEEERPAAGAGRSCSGAGSSG